MIDCDTLLRLVPGRLVPSYCEQSTLAGGEKFCMQYHKQKILEHDQVHFFGILPENLEMKPTEVEIVAFGKIYLCKICHCHRR